MAEIAGLVVGGIPIAIWALEKYAEPLEAFHRYRTSIDTLRADLILQQRHLHTTFSNIGLPQDPTPAELLECFETKFPDISRELMVILQRMDEATAGLLKSLNVDVKGKPEEFSEGLRWEWRKVKHSFTVKKRREVVDELRHRNEDLRRSLEKPELPAQDDNRRVLDLKRRFNISRSNAIRQCLASFHRALEQGFCCSCSTPHKAAIDLDWASYESDSAKKLKIAVTYETESQPQDLGSWRRLDITSETVTKPVDPTPGLLAPSPPVALRPPSPNLSFRSKVAHFGFLRSLSRTPPPSPDPPITSAAPLRTTPNGNPSRALLQVPPAGPPPAEPGVTSLCAALCAEGNPWPLIRFLRDPDEDKTQYSLHNHPVDSPTIVRSIPLKSLFSQRKKHTQRNPYLALSAKQRYSIAATLAWSVLHLSRSPWLDDNWDQKQVGIFLERAKNSREVLSRHPCASYVFSPRVGEDDPPADDFNYLVPNRSVFALGILLIELCISEPVSQPHQDDGLPSTLLEDYESALGRLDEVYRLAGDSYGNATRRCIKFSFEGRDAYNDFDFSTFRQQFYDVVVAPVQATYLTFPDSSYFM